MLFEYFTRKLETLEQTQSRNTIAEILAELLAELSPQEIKPTIYMLQGRIAPKFEPLEFNFSEKQILNSFQENSKEEISKDFETSGDLATSISNHLTIQEGKQLDINNVFEYLKQIAEMSGKDPAKKKQEIFQNLLAQLSNIEIKFAIRIILGDLRLGLSDKTILEAFSLYIYPEKNKLLKEEIERIYGVQSDLGKVGEMIASLAKAIKADTEENKESKERSENIYQKFCEETKNIQIEVFTPIASKLVEREKDLESVVERYPDGFFIQPKYDGLRCQIHCSIDKDTNEYVVKLFSRNMESLTDSFPDIIEDIKAVISQNKIRNIVLDSEIIGVNQETGEYLQFQETIKRKRKHNVDEFAENIQMEIQAFDILYLNDKDLTQIDISDRINTMKDLKIWNQSVCMSESTFVKGSLEAKAEMLELLTEKFEMYVGLGLEGVIIKGVGTHYDAGTRNFDWIKMKRSTDSNLNDTIDGVVLGYYLGKGKRAKFGIGGILIGIWDNLENNYKTICKVGTGFTDEQFVSYKKELDLHLLDSNIEEQNLYIITDKKLEEDLIKVQPKVVVEIEADEITTSTNHSCGYSLRFPRIKIWGRDKDPEQSTNIDEIKRMWEIRFGKDQ